ncbi:Plant self-incompatibility S1, partial [Corchorus capsularis]
MTVTLVKNEEDLLFIKYHIHITNDLPSDLPPGVPYLELHCKSKNKDLGLKKMLRHDDYTWDTKINYWRTTLFFCNAFWEGKQRPNDGCYHNSVPLPSYLNHDGGSSRARNIGLVNL